MSVTSLARKPKVRRIASAAILDELQELDGKTGTRLVSIYLPDAEAHIMYLSVNNKMRWHGAWAPITKQDAIECARETAYEKGVAAENNLFYIPQGFDRGESGYLPCDVDAGTECVDIDALAAYQDRGDDCLLVLYSPARAELQKYRLRDGLCEWWHKSSPHTLADAKRIANRTRREYRLTLDQLHYLEVTTPQP